MFKLKCDHVTTEHTRFTVFDPVGANCGTITVRRMDTFRLLNNWSGRVDWNGKEALMRDPVPMFKPLSTAEDDD